MRGKYILKLVAVSEAPFDLGSSRLHLYGSRIFSEEEKKIWHVQIIKSIILQLAPM